MLLKILLIGTLVAGLMMAVKDGRVLAKAGLVGGCTQLRTTASDGATWQACKRGRLEDYPNLSNKSCTLVGVKRGREYWRCPASLVASHTPRG